MRREKIELIKVLILQKNSISSICTTDFMGQFGATFGSSQGLIIVLYSSNHSWQIQEDHMGCWESHVVGCMQANILPANSLVQEPFD